MRAKVICRYIQTMDHDSKSLLDKFPAFLHVLVPEGRQPVSGGGAVLGVFGSGGGGGGSGGGSGGGVVDVRVIGAGNGHGGGGGGSNSIFGTGSRLVGAASSAFSSSSSFASEADPAVAVAVAAPVASASGDSIVAACTTSSELQRLEEHTKALTEQLSLLVMRVEEMSKRV